VQPAGELAQLLQPGGELLDRAVQQAVLLRGAVAKAAEVEEHRGEALLGAVVEVPLDPLPFLVGDLHEPGARGAQRVLRPLSLGDVAEVAGERGRARKRDARDRQLERELGPVPAPARELEPPVEDHRRARLEEACEASAVGVA
jgi:hypothetical protein